jgi:hypothetical protein
MRDSQRPPWPPTLGEVGMRRSWLPFHPGKRSTKAKIGRRPGVGLAEPESDVVRGPGTKPGDSGDRRGETPQTDAAVETDDVVCNSPSERPDGICPRSREPEAREISGGRIRLEVRTRSAHACTDGCHSSPGGGSMPSEQEAAAEPDAAATLRELTRRDSSL